MCTTTTTTTANHPPGTPPDTPPDTPQPTPPDPLRTPSRTPSQTPSGHPPRPPRQTPPNHPKPPNPGTPPNRASLSKTHGSTTCPNSSASNYLTPGLAARSDPPDWYQTPKNAYFQWSLSREKNAIETSSFREKTFRFRGTPPKPGVPPQTPSGPPPDPLPDPPGGGVWGGYPGGSGGVSKSPGQPVAHCAHARASCTSG